MKGFGAAGWVVAFTLGPVVFGLIIWLYNGGFGGH